MNNTGYILGAWLAVIGGLGAYATYVVVRGRRLARQVPPSRRRWIQSD